MIKLEINLVEPDFLRRESSPEETEGRVNGRGMSRSVSEYFNRQDVSLTGLRRKQTIHQLMSFTTCVLQQARQTSSTRLSSPLLSSPLQNLMIRALSLKSRDA